MKNFLKLKPLVQRSGERSEAEQFADLAKILTNLPIEYWLEHNRKSMFYENATCAPLPSIFELEYNNMYWQTLFTSNGTFQLLSAFYDIRNASKIGPAVRILGVIDRVDPTVKTYCQFWFEDTNSPLLVSTMELKYMWLKEWGVYNHLYQPYVMTCQIPREYHSRIPSSVSMVEQPCDTATNNLKIHFNKPAKKTDFAVCVKGLDLLHEDLSVRLVEWIELVRILGANKIFFYEFYVHPNISKVLRYYEELGMVSVTPLTLPGGQPNIPGFQHIYLYERETYKRLNELIPINDCFYKNMYSYEYIAVFDIDEVIIPVKTKDWRELLDVVIAKSLQLNNKSSAGYEVRNVFFMDDVNHAHDWSASIPKYMHMLQHVNRSRDFDPEGYSVKSFHNTEMAFTIHNHYVLSCLSEDCTSYPIDPNDAQLQHYRLDCFRKRRSTCTPLRSKVTRDTLIWRYKDELIARTTDTLRRLGFFSKPPGVPVGT